MLEGVISAKNLATLAGTTAPAGLPDAVGVSFSTTRLRAGDIFFALPGAKAHGIAYAEEALAAGAAFIVSDQPHPKGIEVADPTALLLELGKIARSHFRGIVIGVTGSAGKTSCKNLLAAVLGAQSTPGNFNTPLAISEILIRTALARHTGAGERLVLELGIDHPGEMDALVALVCPTLAVVTTIAPSHLAELKSVAGVAHEKLKLLDASEHAFVGSSVTPYLSVTQRQLSTIYGLTPHPRLDVVGKLVPHAQGVALEAFALTVPLRVPSQAVAENMLAALSCAHYLGDNLSISAQRLATAQLEPGRLQVHQLPGLTLIDDTYNANPASMTAALEALSHFPKPQSAVLGDMLDLGSASDHYHEALGEETQRLSEVFAIGEEMAALKRTNPKAHYAPALDLETLIPLLPKEGTLLVKGSRGMRLERLVETLLKAQQEGL